MKMKVIVLTHNVDLYQKKKMNSTKMKATNDGTRREQWKEKFGSSWNSQRIMKQWKNMWKWPSINIPIFNFVGRMLVDNEWFCRMLVKKSITFNTEINFRRQFLWRERWFEKVSKFGGKIGISQGKKVTNGKVFRKRSSIEKFLIFGSFYAIFQGTKANKRCYESLWRTLLGMTLGFWPTPKEKKFLPVL